MEPMNIDWKNIDSIFVKDDLYEHINAPKYIDFSAPEESVDDDAWFCRPDCRHPRNAQDFKVKHLRSASSSDIIPLGERNRRDNMKTRGIAPSENPRFRKPPKNFREDGENENPNLSSLPSSNHSITSSKTIKSTIKSSAEKKKRNETNPSEPAADSPKTEEKPRFKSTNSARNLFAGREILNQITEFCNELKKLALNASEKESSTIGMKNPKGMMEKEPLLESEKSVLGGVKEKRNLNSKVFSPEALRRKKMMDDNENSQVSVASDLSCKRKGDKGSLQVRSCPPSPQRFPSPLQPSKSRMAKRGGILQELKQNQKTTNEAIDEENENISVSNAEVRSMDVFWFLKPCAYLEKRRNSTRTEAESKDNKKSN